MKLLIQACWKWTRLWPLSKEKKPKQFMEINWKTFIKRTKNRFNDFLESENDIFYSILGKQKKNLINAVWKVNHDRIIFWNKKAKENISNILISVYTMLKNWIDKNENIIMTWSDLYFENEKNLQNDIQTAIHFLEKNPDKIILSWIEPTEASESFWYIECWKEISKNIFEIDNFKEKPNKQKAEDYLKKWNYFWNWWVFLFKLWFFWEEAEKLCPELSKIIKETIDENKDYWEFIWNNFDEPIDKLIFEKSDKLRCIKIENSWWSDVWNFESLHLLSEKDENWNYISKSKNKVITQNSTWNYIKSESKNIILNWINNLVIIEDWNNLVILDKKDSKGLKELIEKVT